MLFLRERKSNEHGEEVEVLRLNKAKQDEYFY